MIVNENSDSCISMLPGDYAEYHIKLEYDEFEIWISYYLGKINKSYKV